MNPFEQLAGEVDRLRKSQPRIEVLFSRNSLVPQSRINDLRTDLETILGLKIPAAIIESVHVDDNLYAYWKSADRSEEETVFGDFFVRSVLLFAPENDLNEVFQPRSYDIVGNLRETRVFDYYAYNGGPIYSLLRVIDGTIDERVYIFNEREVFATALDYANYLAALRLTRGFLFWQYLFCEKLRPEEYEIRAIRRGLSFVEEGFPEDSYRDLWERLNALEKSRR